MTIFLGHPKIKRTEKRMEGVHNIHIDVPCLLFFVYIALGAILGSFKLDLASLLLRRKIIASYLMAKIYITHAAFIKVLALILVYE